MITILLALIVVVVAGIYIAKKIKKGELIMSEETIKCPKCGTECNKTEKFCGGCGTDLSKKVGTNGAKKCVKNLFTSIIDFVSYIISSCIISVLFAIPLIMAIFALSESKSAENAYQQIYNSVNMTSVALGIGIGVVAALIVTFVIRTTAQLNRIEDKIEEIQNKIQE